MPTTVSTSSCKVSARIHSAKRGITLSGSRSCRMPLTVRMTNRRAGSPLTPIVPIPFFVSLDWYRSPSGRPSLE
jgi:hypothetical protein